MVDKYIKISKHSKSSFSNLTQDNISEITSKIKTNLNQLLKEYSGKQQRLIDYHLFIMRNKNNIKSIKKRYNYNKKKTIEMLSENGKFKHESFRKSKYSEGNKKRKLNFNSQISLENSQITGSNDHMPLTTKNTYKFGNRLIHRSKKSNKFIKY